MDTTVKIDARDVNFWYGDFHALKGISMEIEEKSVVAFIGPSGLLGKPVQKLVKSMSESNNNNTKSYNFSYSFDELGNVVLCQYLYDNKNVTVKYGY